jgi:hypothetical protein
MHHPEEALAPLIRIVFLENDPLLLAPLILSSPNFLLCVSNTSVTHEQNYEVEHDRLDGNEPLEMPT